jgi:PASTA domain
VTAFASARAYVGHSLLVAVVLLATALVLPAVASAQSAPPETTITQAPPNPSGSKQATFAFTGTDDTTPAIDLEFECRLDVHLAPPGTDPLDLWLECLSPQFFTGLAVGQHVFEVQATDADGLVDPTPAVYAWTVLPPQTCLDANGTSIAEADAWIDEHSPIDNKGDDSTLKVISKAPAENTRAVVQFPLPQAPAGCVVQSATLRLYSDSVPSTPRTLQALRLTSAWGENNVNWSNQPAAAAPAAETSAGFGYVQWNVTAQVQAMYAAGNFGFLIRDANENDPAGNEEGFFSKEKLENPPQLVVCFDGCSGGGVPPPPPPVIPPPLPVPPPGVVPAPLPPGVVPAPLPPGVVPAPLPPGVVPAPLPPRVVPAPRPPVTVTPRGPSLALRCHLPNIKRQTLRKARAALARRGCAVGTIRRKFSKVRKGRVIAQSRRPGARLYRGFRVNLVVSKGKKPRKARR